MKHSTYLYKVINQQIKYTEHSHADIRSNATNTAPPPPPSS
jgi:hypothetical protein